MAFNINKSLSSDFGGNIGYGSITDDINNSSITIQFNGLSTNGDIVVFHFESELSPTELIEFNNVVNNYIYVSDDTIRNEGVFGTEYHYIEDEEISTTTSNIFVGKLRLTTRNIPEGEYRISWNYQWNLESTISYDFKGRVQIDDSIIIMTHQEEPKDGGVNQLRQLSGFKTIDLTDGVHTIDIDFCRSDSQGTAIISNARIEIFRVG
jgi:hypothetical protein